MISWFFSLRLNFFNYFTEYGFFSRVYINTLKPVLQISKIVINISVTEIVLFLRLTDDFQRNTQLMIFILHVMCEWTVYVHVYITMYVKKTQFKSKHFTNVSYTCIFSALLTMLLVINCLQNFLD